MRRVVGPPFAPRRGRGGDVRACVVAPVLAVGVGALAVVGDRTRGKTVFAASCAGCHGADASGGVGPALAGSGLTAAEVAAVVAAGRGVMPAGIVEGQDAADVAAYVASLSQ